VGIIRSLRHLCAIALSVHLVTFFAIVGFAATFTNPTTAPKADAIVCLGGGAKKDGSLAASSRGRAEACTDLYLDGAAPLLVFTGTNIDPALPSVAAEMAQIAFDRGVQESAVRIEHASHSTLQNALFSKPYLTEADSIILVTQGFHLPRSRLSCAAMGPWNITLWMSDRFGRKPNGNIKWLTHHREALALWFNLARYSVWWLAKSLGFGQYDAILT